MTDAQVHVIAICEQSDKKLETLFDLAQNAGLLILAGEILSMKRSLRDAIEMQCRAFRDDSLVDKHPLFPQGQFPYGKKF